MREPKLAPGPDLVKLIAEMDLVFEAHLILGTGHEVATGRPALGR